MKIKSKAKKQSIEKQIFQTNTLMVFIILSLFASINLIILKIYWELIEQKINTHTLTLYNSKALYQTSGEVERFLQELLLTGEHFFLFFILDAILCISVLLFVSILFTKKLTKRIMEPLHELKAGTIRMKAGNLKEPVIYSGNMEFEEICLAFNEMQEHILAEQEKNRRYEKARINMIAGISHDLRTPLTAISGTIKGLLDNVASTKETQKLFLQTAYRRSLDMNLLLQKLFDFSKLETGNMPLTLRRTNLSDFLQKYVQAASQLSDTVHYFYTCPQNERCALLDPLQLNRIFDNLTENSMKYAGSDPLEIYLSLTFDDTLATCHFRDNGVGIPEEKLTHIFDEFYRADESRSEKNGSGLGLYIVKTLTEAMNGTVSACNKNGLWITLTFPLVKGDDVHG